MTEKEKADSLISIFEFQPKRKDSAKKVADEVIEALKVLLNNCNLDTVNFRICMDEVKYWKRIKQEIDKS